MNIENIFPQKRFEISWKYQIEFKNNLTQLCRRLARFELKIAEIEFDIQ